MYDMKEHSISPEISYIEGTADPLSADVGIIRTAGGVWLYDVGCHPALPSLLPLCDAVLLSHFHRDHTGNIGSIHTNAIYGSAETCRHIHGGSVIREACTFGELRLFPIPSSHAKGCIGLEVNGTYAFVGDALYGRTRNNAYSYNAQLLLEEIRVLSGLKASLFLVSHSMGQVRSKESVLTELEGIYRLRKKNDPEIRLAPEDPA